MLTTITTTLLRKIKGMFKILVTKGDDGSERVENASFLLSSRVSKTYV